MTDPAGTMARTAAAIPAQVRLRPLDGTDLDQVVALFEGLSARSRYLRFFTLNPRAQSTTLHHLASVDHRMRESVGAFDAGVLVGAAHYLRSTEDPNRAEISIEVSDSHQRRGLGARLLNELACVARRRGILEFTAAALGENRAVFSLLRRAGWPVESRFFGPELTLTMTLPDCSVGSPR